MEPMKALCARLRQEAETRMGMLREAALRVILRARRIGELFSDANTVFGGAPGGERYRKLCQSLEGLEREQRELQSLLWHFFLLESDFLEAMLACEREEDAESLRQLFGRYLEACNGFAQDLKDTLEAFPKSIAAAADMEHMGVGCRARKLRELCGALESRFSGLLEQSKDFFR